ncbi:MAG TPA: MlaD family protein [Candidatus Sumerlaeota bacterium]|nr:MlaD family protein [Candidatus Sumerlaeota bacterium]
MATRAQKVRVGIFLFVGMALMILVLFLISGVERYKTSIYHVYFEESVTGLDKGGEVRYNGVPVGKVEEIEIHSYQAKGRVKVTLRIRRDVIPEMNDTMKARLGLRGITGIVYVELFGGEGGKALPQDGVITAVPSLINNMTTALPEVLTSLSSIMQKVDVALGSDPAVFKTRVDDMFTHWTHTGESMAILMDNLTTDSRMISTRIAEVLNTLNTRSQDAGSSLTVVMTGLDSAIKELELTIREARRVLEDVDPKAYQHDWRGIADSFRTTSDNVEAFLQTTGHAVDNIEYDLMLNLKQLNETLAAAENLIRSLERNPSALIFGSGETGRPRQTRGKD